jgi:hypothetical protein
MSPAQYSESRRDRVLRALVAGATFFVGIMLVNLVYLDQPWTLRRLGVLGFVAVLLGLTTYALRSRSAK